MLELRITKNNQHVRTLILGEDFERMRILRAGRAPGSEIPLDPDPGISREHFQLIFQDERWRVVQKSRHGLLKVQGQSTADFELQPGLAFEVGAYRFVVSAVGGEAFENSDRTQVGVFTYVAYLRVRNPQGDSLALHKLSTGNTWIVGRDPGCSICIDNPKFSRQHLEITRVGEQFFARDLGSSNGTRLNGRDLVEQEAVILRSLDVLQVVDWSLVFELRDAQYEARLSEIDQNLEHLPVASEDWDAAHSAASLSGSASSGGAYLEENPVMGYGNSLPPHSTSRGLPLGRGLSAEKKKLVLYGVIGVGVLILAILFSGESPKEEASKAQGPISTPFDRLGPEQKVYVQQSYKMGQQLLMQGKYELARQEMIKVHQLVPAFEDSKQIEEMAETALKTLREKELLESRERERLETESKIQAQVQLCRSQMNANTSMVDLESCLSPILSLNPEHPDIQSLRSQIEKRETERQMNEAARQEREERVARLRSLFLRAQKLDQEGNNREAQLAYQKVLGSSLPDPQDLKAKARSRLQQMRSEALQRQAGLIAKADQAVQMNQLKDAILAYRAALKIDSNPDLDEKVKGIEKEHRRLMQNLYQEAVLEESIGEVSAAQAKWRKVIEQSYPQEEYYQKSRIKLRKYGG